MEKYIRKYFITMIVLVFLYGGMMVFVVSQLQFILFAYDVGMEESGNIVRLISNYLIYFINIILALIIYFDMKKFRNISVPILLLVVLQNLVGLAFFFIGYNNELDNKIK
ncbi:MAG TPA: hypothetical protein DCR43_07200 [Bacteroidales bacterium]|nr:MAG: hypothetical protein A2X11_16670 [Bacteroidetes bacterium GWE2_42_24]OFY26323.1 MAG: hypothetical protein A2X09_00025 [Bacteroidetes bacterium GWF2_43_11]PKP25204.1 MAG: hypothetical protein CVU06_04330 [Bacteroidetes bacterium HGW-Bacteroidetes-22]HAQ65620.1 hypothetical protein [Bacteroidales bacterium]HBZ66926.1 hypothetical protein [Bacteroidales bacterium]